MKTTLSTLLALSIAGLPLGAVAGNLDPQGAPFIHEVDASGNIGGRAPWSRGWEYDSGQRQRSPPRAALLSAGARPADGRSGPQPAAG